LFHNTVSQLLVIETRLEGSIVFLPFISEKQHSCQK